MKIIDKEKFYKSKVWRNKREKILRRDGYLCQHCKWYGKRTEAETVHHIKHLEEYPELALVSSNLISLCKKCHNKEHPEKRRKKKMITVVCGYPGAGKTTYVKEHKKYNDVMLDLDIIYNAITSNKMYEEIRPKNIINYINDLIKATIYKSEEYNFDMWLIRCCVDDIELEILKENKAKIIWLDTTREECRERLFKEKRLNSSFEFICNRVDKKRKMMWF